MKIRGKDGFTLIETVMALALLTLMGAAFFTLSAGSLKTLAMGQRMNRLDDKALEMVLDRKGSATGEKLRFRFWTEDEEAAEIDIQEVLREYEVQAEEGGQEIRIYYYR